MTPKAVGYLMSIALLLALPGLAAAYPHELSVVVSEELDAQAESDGAFTWNYNLTGGMLSVQVLNENSSVGLGVSDTRLFDIYVPFSDTNAVLNLSTCDLIIDDAAIANDPCMVQICDLVDGAPPTAQDCICGDFDLATSLNISRSLMTAYNPNLNGTATSNYVLHINELQGDSSVMLSCGLNGTGFVQQGFFPVSFGESFSPRKIVNNACTTVSVQLNLTNKFDSSPCEDLSITVKKVLSTGPDWSYLNATSAGQGGSIEGDKNITWTFNLSANDTQTLDFTVLACPNMTGNTSKLEMGRAYVDFQLINTTCANSTFTNVSVGHVSAVGPGEVNLTKEHYINSNPPNWAENATFYDSSVDLNYTIYRFRLWAENGTDPSSVDPNNPAIAGSDHNCTGLPAGLAAGGTFQCDGKTFNSSDIPVVFGKPVFELVEGGISGWADYIQFENSKNESLPLNSDYFLIENMWVINGYLVRATKTVTPAATAGCYNVTITVTNLGDTCTPYLYVYDIVPEEFYSMTGSVINNMTSPWNIGVSDTVPLTGFLTGLAKPGNAQPLLSYGIYDMTDAFLLAFSTPPVITENWTLGNLTHTFNDSQYTGKTEGLTGTYAGTGYRWELFPMSAATAGVGDECPADTYSNLNITASQTVYITYALCADTANTTYYPSELFIVGVDPVNVEGAAAPLASVGFGSGEKSGEPLLMVFLAVLAVIAAALFVKRRRA